MSRSTRTHQSVDQLTSEIEHFVRRLKADLGNQNLREKVCRLAELQQKIRRLSVNVVAEEGLSRTAGKERIRRYLVQHVGLVISSAELEVVGGISEYARRVRELRVKEGYRIATGASPDPFSGIDLGPNQYLLTTDVVDADSANRWKVANRIRRMRASVKNRILEFLKENVLKVVTTEELAYVAQGKREFGRRTRELRTEEGYAIATRFSGRPDLGMGEYVLLSLDRIAEPHDRHIPDAVQKQVYARDENRCRNPACRYQWTPDDPRILELHHIIAHAKRGPNTAENLLVLCSLCHDDVHAGRLDIQECLIQ